MAIRNTILGKIRRNDDAATIVEFALLSPVFFFAVFATIEYSLFFFKSHFLKHVLYEVARDVQTGEIQQATDPRAAFDQVVCDTALPPLACSRIHFDVRAFDSVADVTFPDAAFDADTGAPTNFVFQPGGGDRVTAMRVSTTHTFVTPFMQDIFQPDGTPALMVGYTISRNEPF